MTPGSGSATGMAQPPAQGIRAWARLPGSVLGLLVAMLLFAGGLAAALGPAWGYALLMLAAGLLMAGMASFAVLALTSRGDAQQLWAAAAKAFLAAAWVYGWGVCALGGHFAHETLQGRMPLHWVVFGLSALAALIVLDIGLYRRLVAYQRVTWGRYSRHLSRAQAQPAAMRRTLVDEVVLQRSLRATSALRWWRHTLIFWGFVLMLATEMLAVVFREAVPAFGWHDIWREPGHPLRAAFDFAFDLFGIMVLIGCLLALFWRWRVNGTAQQKFSDTPTVVFLLLVVASGFALEALRLAGAADTPRAWASFAGMALAQLFSPTAAAALHAPVWYGHAIASCLFIAYVPLKRLVHSCATPIGRLMHSQQHLLAAKKQGVLAGLMKQSTTVGPAQRP